eukprot:1876225-Amphidinium_carterae.1
MDMPHKHNCCKKGGLTKSALGDKQHLALPYGTGPQPTEIFRPYTLCFSCCEWLQYGNVLKKVTSCVAVVECQARSRLQPSGFESWLLADHRTLASADHLRDLSSERKVLGMDAS